MGCFTVLKRKTKKKMSENARNPSSASHVLPEHQKPHSTSILHSAPPSFRTRVKPLQQSSSNHGRIRTLSAPSSLDAAKQDAADFGEQQEDLKKDQHHFDDPQPLPLPSSCIANNALRPASSFKVANVPPPDDMSGPLPLPPPCSVVNFTHEEIASACHNFSPERCLSESLHSIVYRATFSEDSFGSKKVEATVTRLHPSNQSLREFTNDVNMLASLQHPFLCKLIGFHGWKNSDQRMLVYERLFHGSLDRLLYGRSDGPPMDWNSRMRVASCAAQGLTFLHEEGPFQAMFFDFSTANVQIDKDFSAKLSGYGCIAHIPEADISSSSVSAKGNLSVETVERGLLTPKSNVWSFGIMLLELLTGRRKLQQRDERNNDLVKWSRPFLADDCRLSLIMDPQLKGRFPTKAARAVADIAQHCLQTDPSSRPTMRRIANHLKAIQDMRYTTRFPLQEPGRYLSKSPSLNGMPPPSSKTMAVLNSQGRIL
ncbi:hypothetical protein M569_00992, partial [Genlisea aurea]